MAKAKKSEVQNRRGGDRRESADRRKSNVAVAEERRQTPRRKVQRRRQIDPTTCERDYSGDEIEFMQALDAYKRRSGRMFPTCSEILDVIRDLGYVRLSEDDGAATGDKISVSAAALVDVEAEEEDADATDLGDEDADE
jgi:hypothetical protein